MFYIYWIHQTNHTDPYTEGYVGLSNQPDKRFKAHTTKTAQVGSKYLRELSDSDKALLSHTILAECSSLEQARELELKYRPLPHIGWNIKRGGGVSPDCTGRVHSEQTKKDIARKNTLTKSTRTYVSPFKGDTERHSEETKALIGSYHKGKTISEEHKQAITDKLSGVNHTKSLAITITDNVTGITKDYVNIREASEQLGITYSTLRSAVRNNQKLVYKRFEIVKVAK